MKKTSKYFIDEEFRACVPSCGIDDMQQTTLNMLDMARGFAGIPFVLNSAYRTSGYDKRKGRSGTGSHTTGHAVDIRCNSDSNRFIVVKALLKAGFTRIGVSKTFVHADNSDKHTQDVIWAY